MLLPGTAGVSPALSANREKRAMQARRLRSQARGVFTTSQSNKQLRSLVSTERRLESRGVAAAHHERLRYLAKVNAVGSIEPTFESLDVVDIDDRRTMYSREVFCGQTFFPIS
jgi:hypothetical protein